MIDFVGKEKLTEQLTFMKYFEGNLENKLNKITTKLDMDHMDKWIRYVYHTNDSITTLNDCGGECYFRKDEPCHFYVFHEETCYLGNFNSIDDSLTAPNKSANVYLNQGISKQIINGNDCTYNPKS